MEQRNFEARGVICTTFNPLRTQDVKSFTDNVMKLIKKEKQLLQRNISGTAEHNTIYGTIIRNFLKAVLGAEFVGALNLDSNLTNEWIKIYYAFMVYVENEQAKKRVLDAVESNKTSDYAVAENDDLLAW